MTPKKTLSNWLTNRYLLIIRNEENFAEKKTISFTYAKGILVFTVAFIVTLIAAVYLVTFVLEQWLDPRYAIMASNRELVDLTMKLDSLQYEVETKDKYLENVRKILSGDVESLKMVPEDQAESISGSEVEFGEQINPIDSQIRAEFEQQDVDVLSYQPSKDDDFREIFLFTPISGIISDGFNPKKDHYGVDIVAKENEPVKCVADGVVVFSSWTLDSGYVIGVQHRGNLISVYKHNSELLKNVGNFVSGGEIIAIIGNTGELTSGPHLHFELWHNGNSVNPQEYVAF